MDPEDNETVADAAEAALLQIETQKYETELPDRGIEKIKKLAVVFSRKNIRMDKGRLLRSSETTSHGCKGKRFYRDRQ